MLTQGDCWACLLRGKDRVLERERVGDEDHLKGAMGDIVSSSGVASNVVG